MSHFAMEASDDFQEDFHLDILHKNMNISRLMMHANHVEEARA